MRIAVKYVYSSDQGTIGDFVYEDLSHKATREQLEEQAFADLAADYPGHGTDVALFKYEDEPERLAVSVRVYEPATAAPLAVVA